MRTKTKNIIGIASPWVPVSPGEASPRVLPALISTDGNGIESLFGAINVSQIQTQWRDFASQNEPVNLINFYLLDPEYVDLWPNSSIFFLFYNIRNLDRHVIEQYRYMKKIILEYRPVLYGIGKLLMSRTKKFELFGPMVNSQLLF